MQPTNNGSTILLGEDELEVRGYLEMALRCHGYSVEAARDGDEVLGYLHNGGGAVAAVLLDILMPRKGGLETLKEIRREHKDLPVIMVSGASSPLTVVEAMRSGATDFLPKPVSPEDLGNALRQAIGKMPAESSEAAPQPAAPATKAYFGFNPSMKEIHSFIARIGWSEVPVLIQGETGVGKEVTARELHARSPRGAKPFLKLNCAALPSELVESELFGYERGAFTGAFQKKPGMFEVADGGTIFLDEIGDMDYKLQAKLLQVLQDQEFQRLGGKETVRVDVRVIAATHRDLESAIVDGTFREDLYYRLNVINLRIPPLRERKDDILPLAEFLLRKYAVDGETLPSMTPPLKQALLAHDWPGNIRELENVIRKLTVLREPDLVAAELRSKTPRRLLHRETAKESEADTTILDQVTKAKERAETKAILAALHSTHWNRKQAAALLKIDYKALLYKMKKLAIEDRVAALPADSGEVKAHRNGGALS